MVPSPHGDLLQEMLNLLVGILAIPFHSTPSSAISNALSLIYSATKQEVRRGVEEVGTFFNRSDVPAHQCDSNSRLFNIF